MSGPQETLRVLRSQSLSSVIQDEVEQRILSGAIPAGSRVNENGLAAELGVSRGPVREACRGLVEMGLLTAIVNRGFFVREVTAKDAIDVYDVRTSLMRLAGETLARRVTEAQLGLLDRLVADMDRAEADGDFDAFYDLNREFHDRIVDFAENDRLRALCDGLVKELHLYRRRSLLQGGGLSVSNTEHKRILEALRARDPDLSGAALEKHMQASKARFLAAAEAGTDTEEHPTRGERT